MSDPILCRECGHDIDEHQSPDKRTDCWRCLYGRSGDDRCTLTLIDIARAYADERVRDADEAEPTDVEVEAARVAIHQALAQDWMAIANVLGDVQSEYDSLLDSLARAALSAARDARKASHE